MVDGGVRSSDVRRVLLVVFVVLGVVYALTLAPGLTWWDAGELALAADGFGIPHPPGTALYVVVARSWHLLLPGVSTVLATNLLSAMATAAGCALLGGWVATSTGDRWSGVAAGITAGAMTSVWRNATETEVYALVFLAIALVIVAADAAGRRRGARWRLVTLYALVLGYALHPGVLVVAPMAALLAWPVAPAVAPVPRPSARRKRARTSGWGEMLAAIALLLLALSALGLLWMRAWHDPVLNQGNAATLEAWRDVVGRAQYGSTGAWPRQSPWWAQVGMVVQYFDWQFALGVSPSAVPTWPRAVLSAAALVVLCIGARWHWQRDRRTARAVAVLLLAGTLGAALALNFKTGWSFSLGNLSDGAVREVRERDYFFAFGFAACGVWYGLGVRALARRAAVAWPGREFVVGAFGVLAPVLLNWPATTRRGVEAALPHAFAERILRELPRDAVFAASADNELYPLWYLQGAERLRPDVLVLAMPLLPTAWYRAELARRHQMDVGTDWAGVAAMRGRVLAAAAKQGRPVFEPTYADDSVLKALWVRGGRLVGGHAEPFSRVVAALLRSGVVVRTVDGRR